MMRVWVVLAAACGSAPVQAPRTPAVERCSGLVTCEAACTRGAIDDCDEAAKRMQASPDEADAARYAAVLARSCDAGRAVACLSLVEVVKYAPSLPVDEARASALNRRACELGEGMACLAIGRSHDVDAAQFIALHQRTVSLLESKCEAHDGKSCIARWALYAAEAPDGEKTRMYRVHAADDLERGCLAGSGPDCTAAAMMVIAAPGDQDLERAVGLLERGCSMGEIEACVRIGKNVDYDKPAKGREALRMACDGGREDGCLALASMTEDMRLLERGIRLARAGCALGKDRPCDSLAKLLNFHAMPPADIAQAADLVERVCRRGLPVLCHNLAQILDAGSAPLRDIVRIVSLEKAACDGGWRPACPAEIEAHPRLEVVILDRRTGLEWAPVSSREGTRADAVQHCALINGNYRLPTSIELETLVERTSDVRPFARGTLPREGFLFSSEVVNGAADSPWVMNLRNGHISSGKDYRGFARCVRVALTGAKLAISRKLARVKPSVLRVAIRGQDFEYSLRTAAGKIVNAATINKVAVPPYSSSSLRYSGATLSGPVEVEVAPNVDWDLAEKFLMSAKDSGLELTHIAVD